MSAMACAGFFALCSPALASVAECDYSNTYDNVKTLYVARDGSGDYNCDGSDDQVEINRAFQKVKDSKGKYTSVFLKSGTYIIGASVIMANNSVLEGDKDAVLKLKDQADWTFNVPIITAPAPASGNIEIKCFEADANYAGNFSMDAYDCMAGKETCAKDDYACCEAYSPFRTTGRGYYSVAGFNYGDKYSVHDMYLHDGLNDGLNIMHASNVKFYDNVVYKMGHDGFYVKYSETAEAYGNKITTRTNSGLRADNANHISFHDNDIQAFDNWSAGGPGIEIVKDARAAIPMNDILIFNNYIHGTYGQGIWITASGNYKKSDLAANIHHNIFSENGLNPAIDWTAGILTAGFYNLTIENNVFDKSYNGALVISNAVANAPSGSGYVTTFRNNIITDTQPQRNTTSNGYGIVNLLSDTHTVNSQNNCFYDNYAGDSYGAVKSTDDLNADPLYADAAGHDYHLQSSWGRRKDSSWVKDKKNSPCIDAGYAASTYALEPANNGGCINIGRYGNTAQASKSPSSSAHLLTVAKGTGGGSYAAGAKVTIKANTPAKGKIFDKWTGDTAYVSNAKSATATVTMPDKAVTLQATYKTAYCLTVNNGTGDGWYAAGAKVTVKADAPAKNKVFSKWTGDVDFLSRTDSPCVTLTMPSEPVEVTANYKSKKS